MCRRLLLAAAMTAALVSSTAAHAQNDARERSRAAFRRGVAQVEAGDYSAARDSFLEAYRIYAHPSILLNLGIARAHTGQWLEAEQDLVHFLADDGGAQAGELASARAELQQARAHLGTFRLRVAPGGARARLDARALALIPGEFVDVRTTRGPHVLHVEADGLPSADRSVVVDAERSPNVDISLGTSGVVATGLAAPVGAAGGAGEHPAASGDGGRVAGWFFLGAGVVAAGVGAYAGVESKSLADSYNTRGDPHFQDPATKASGLVFRTSADIAFVGALALGGIGLYLVLSGTSSPPAQARLVVGPWSGIAGSF